ncbi:hypothetical protein [Bacillus gobiensis]|uniref:hypothetical protein n=1 Tax=Bacillus gobiensis TaxID=1441095 RepID=UPI003D1F273D
MTILALDGLMRVGKTSTIQYLKKELTGIRVIEEVLPIKLIEAENQFLNEGDDNFYICNDWAKSRLIGQHVEEKWVVMDRYFLSTIAYMFSRDKEFPNIECIKEKTQQLFGGINLPDIWILIVCDPVASWKRSCEQIGLENLGLWGDLSFVKRLSLNFERIFELFSSLYPFVKLFIIKSDELVANPNMLKKFLREE